MSRRFLTAAGALVISLGLPNGAVTAEAPRVIEEIVVTAQKREQAIEDVPISMSVLDGDFLEREAITDFRDLSIFVPNVHLQESSFLTLPKIRGFTVISDNIAFEPPVGLVLDGIPYTRLSYFQAALFDVGRVEVLRGPQGTTFGKNTTAGILHVIPRRPTEELEGHVDVQLGELDRRRIEAAVGGPLLPGNVTFRLSGLLDERDGFMSNTTAAVHPDAIDRSLGRERTGLRAQIGILDILGSSWNVSYERFDLETIGLGGELFAVPDPVRSVILDYDPDADFELGNERLSIEARDARNSTIDSIVANGEWDVGEWGVQMVTGYSELFTRAASDGDISPVPAINAVSLERSPTITTELRTVSPPLGGLLGLASLFGRPLGATDLLAGIFYQHRRIAESDFRLPLFTGPFTRMFAADTGAPPPGAPAVLPDDEFVEELAMLYEQTAWTIAGFAETAWHPLESWTLQYGMRLSHETKDGRWQTRFNQPAPPVLTAAGFREFDAERNRSELQFQPKVSVNYRPFEEISVFASWARGFKGGGFNAFAFGDTDPELLYDSESASQWAIDVKSRLLDNTARVNVSLFRMLVEDFQVLTQRSGGPGDIVTIYLVENAPKALAQGVEVDATWLVSNWLTVLAALGFNDTEYLDFPFADCPPGETNRDGDEDNRCDVSGRPFAFAPKWNATLTPQVNVPLADLGVAVAPANWALAGSLTVEVVDDQFLNPDLDARKRQPAYVRLKASVGLEDLGGNWSLRIVGDNLTDEDVSVYQSNSAAAPSTPWSLADPPRLVFGQLRWAF